MAIEQNILDELKEKLLAEKVRIEGELERFATKTSEGDYKTRFPDDIGNEQGENAIEVEQYAGNLALEQSLEAQLRDVIDALKKMDEGTYGVDEDTGEEIAIERLRAYPAARKTVSKE
jgi:RNA polymerase-binding transcription factor DksA